MFFQKKNPYRKKKIHVLVLGNRGAGKTSLLATTLYNNETLKSMGIDFTADGDTGRLLNESIEGIKNMFNTEDDIKAGDGIEGTAGFKDFEFQLKFTDKSWNEKSEFHIIFHDYAGGILTAGKDDKQNYANKRKIKDYFLESQIVFILIDTPYLMEATEETARKHSAKEQILALFQEAGEECDGKMVAIVPTKCEYYLQRKNQITNVKSKIQREFEDIIACIERLNPSEDEEKYELYFTPVQTVGGLEFCKMTGQKEGTESETVDFRRTKPGSCFEPKNTDLLLLLCMKYVFENLLKYLPTQIKAKKRKKIIKFIEKSDKKEKLLNDCIEKYHELEKNNANDKERDACFSEMLQEFFSKYSDRGSIIKEICGMADKIKDWHIIDSNIKKLEDKFSNDFQQYFDKL